MNNNPDIFSSGLAKAVAGWTGGGQLGAVDRGRDADMGRPYIGAPKRNVWDLLSLLNTGEDYSTAKGGGQSGWHPGQVNSDVPGQNVVPPNFSLRPSDNASAPQPSWMAQKLAGLMGVQN